MHHLTDRDLAALIETRSDQAFREVYRRQARHVYGLALRLTRNRVLAQDVTQEVFVRFWNRPEAYDPERGTIRSFLLSHTHGRSIDLIRSESSRRTREERDAQVAPPSQASLEEQVMDLVHAEQVRVALASLGDKERQAIELAYLGGYTYRQVAELLGEPEGTVKSRIRVGLQRLHDRLTGAGLVAAG